MPPSLLLVGTNSHSPQPFLPTDVSLRPSAVAPRVSSEPQAPDWGGHPLVRVRAAEVSSYRLVLGGRC